VTVTEVPAGLNDGVPGVLIALTGDGEAARHLKGAQSSLGGDTEHTGIDAGRLEAGRAKTALQITDCVAACTDS
jgi:hypothetical protein